MARLTPNLGGLVPVRAVMWESGVNLGTVGGLVPDPIAMEHAFLQSSSMAQWYTLAKKRFQIICGHFRIPSTMHRTLTVKPYIRYRVYIVYIGTLYRVQRLKFTRLGALVGPYPLY